MNDGRYYIWNGVAYPSVTSILRVISKPDLVSWAARCVAERALAHLDKLKEMGREEALGWLKDAPVEERQRAAERGSKIHRLAELFASGGRIEVDRDVMPYAQQLIQFMQEYQPRIVMSEKTVYNTTHGYAGTLDAIVRMGGKQVLLDFKTGKYIYPEYILQVAAYRNAEFIGSVDGVARPIPHTDSAAIVHITPLGYRVVEVDTGAETFSVFLAAVKLAKWLTSWSGT